MALATEKRGQKQQGSRHGEAYPRQVRCHRGDREDCGEDEGLGAEEVGQAEAQTGEDSAIRGEPRSRTPRVEIHREPAAQCQAGGLAQHGSRQHN